MLRSKGIDVSKIVSSFAMDTAAWICICNG